MVMSPTVYSVVQRQDEWHVVKAGSGKPEGRYKSKADAIERGRRLALLEENAVLRVAAVGGAIQSEESFGRDPRILEGA